MILNSSSMMVPLKSRPPTVISSRRTALQPSAMASFNNFTKQKTTTTNNRMDTEQLRTQLDQLHAEAEITRSKANNARLRLMRLSEAAENLQRRAATEVLVGKETEARELLIQKKKLMQALEKSKNRIEVLDGLAAKINEAISLKETQLIGKVAMYPEVSQQESDHQIRFISPKEAIDEDSDKINVSDKDCVSPGQSEELETRMFEANLSVDCEELINEEAASIDTSNGDNMISSLKDISSYEDFLEHLDGQLRQVESDLVMFLRLSTLILESEQKQMNTKVQQTSRILEDVRSIRGRIASIIKTTIDDSYN